MKHALIQSLSIFTFSSLAFFGVAAYAGDDNIEVTPIQQVTQQELAAIYVLSEICPGLVSDTAKFNQGYAKLAQEYLPKTANPVATLARLSKDQKFSEILAEAHADAKKAGDDKNQAICLELTTYAN